LDDAFNSDFERNVLSEIGAILSMDLTRTTLQFKCADRSSGWADVGMDGHSFRRLARSVALLETSIDEGNLMVARIAKDEIVDTLGAHATDAMAMMRFMLWLEAQIVEGEPECSEPS
jgi:hypothetical protein